MMKKHFVLFAAVPALLCAPVAMAQQYPILDMIAQKVITKYQSASCEQLWQQKGKPKSPEEQRFMKLLESDPQARTIFINQVAGPVVNKMFECGMLP
jgi:hypothetical protein